MTRVMSYEELGAIIRENRVMGTRIMVPSLQQYRAFHMDLVNGSGVRQGAKGMGGHDWLYNIVSPVRVQ